MDQNLKDIVDHYPVLVADPPVSPCVPYYFLNGAQYHPPPSSISSTFSNIGLSPSLHYGGLLLQEMGLSGLYKTHVTGPGSWFSQASATYLLAAVASPFH